MQTEINLKNIFKGRQQDATLIFNLINSRSS